MNLAVFAYSRKGCETARRVLQTMGKDCECRAFTMERFEERGFSPIQKPSPSFYGPLFQWADAMVFVGACGIAVREIAPHVKDKRTDPAVLSVDELGKFVIPLLSGHIGGANELAKSLAEQLDAIPVITTATDINHKFSVDSWATTHGFAIDNMHAAKSVSAAILESPVALHSDFPIVTPLPNGVVSGDHGSVGICLSWETKKLYEETLLLVPKILHLGIGCRKGTSIEAIQELVEDVLNQYHIHPKALKCVSSIDLKKEESGLLSFCEARGLPVSFYTSEELKAVKGEFTPSEFVKHITGVDNVCERAALIHAEKLIVKKTARNGVTVAVAAENLEVRFE